MACIATMKTEEDVLTVGPQLDEVHKVFLYPCNISDIISSNLLTISCILFM
jgi:hypothetical protein